MDVSVYMRNVTSYPSSHTHGTGKWVPLIVVYPLNNTPPKFNMEPEDDGFQKESPFPLVDFQVPC